jgi:hypothetical protein
VYAPLKESNAHATSKQKITKAYHMHGESHIKQVPEALSLETKQAGHEADH